MYTDGAINKKVNNYSSPVSPRISRLYLLPKLHKPGIPGRPILSSCGSPTENISRFVDYFLRPLTRALPFYIRDTTDFLQKLRELPVLPPESLLVTLDVSSLYTNILHDEGVNVCEEFLNTRTDQSPPTKDLCQLIQLILESNAFIFNGAYYLQLQGTAMGTQLAPSYANLFMGRFEQQFLWTQNKLPLVWWRYSTSTMCSPFGHTGSHAWTCSYGNWTTTTRQLP